MREYRAFLDFVSKRQGEEFILATLIETEGSTYRKAGAEKIISSSGDSVGLISGGCLEAEIVKSALEGESEEFTSTFDTRSEQDRLFGYGIGCQGKLTLEFKKMNWQKICEHLERQAAQKRLFVHVVGLGPDLDPLKDIFESLGWWQTFYSCQTDLVDQRAAEGWEARKLSSDMTIEVEDPERTAVLLMSHSYSTDLEVLAGLVKSRLPAYLGILGPRARKEKMLEDLTTIYDLTFPEERLEILHGPVGLDGIGRGEAAISLSIGAELQKVFYGDHA